MLFVRLNDVIFPCVSYHGAAFACVAVLLSWLAHYFFLTLVQMLVKFECLLVHQN